MKKIFSFILIFGFLFSSLNIFADETFDGDNWNDSEKSTVVSNSDKKAATKKEEKSAN